MHNAFKPNITALKVVSGIDKYSKAFIIHSNFGRKIPCKCRMRVYLQMEKKELIFQAEELLCLFGEKRNVQEEHNCVSGYISWVKKKKRL